MLPSDAKGGPFILGFRWEGLGMNGGREDQMEVTDVRSFVEGILEADIMWEPKERETKRPVDPLHTVVAPKGFGGRM